MMLNMRYIKLTGMHAVHCYTVMDSYSEVESLMKWMLHCETNSDEKQIVDESELSNRSLWQPLM